MPKCMQCNATPFLNYNNGKTSLVAHLESFNPRDTRKLTTKNLKYSYCFKASKRWIEKYRKRKFVPQNIFVHPRNLQLRSGVSPLGEHVVRVIEGISCAVFFCLFVLGAKLAAREFLRNVKSKKPSYGLWKDGMSVASKLFWRPSWIWKSRAQTAKHIMVHNTHFHFPSIFLLHCKAEWARFPPLDYHTFFRTFPPIYVLYNREKSLTFPAY